MYLISSFAFYQPAKAAFHLAEESKTENELFQSTQVKILCFDVTLPLTILLIQTTFGHDQSLYSEECQLESASVSYVAAIMCLQTI